MENIIIKLLVTVLFYSSSSILLLITTTTTTCHAFTNSINNNNNHIVLSTKTIPSSRLFGISEWRDTIFDTTSTTPNDNDNDDNAILDQDTLLQKSVCILPFPYIDVLLQGETKELRLYEERFTLLFDDVMNNHGGVVAMGLLAPPSGIVQTVPLAEVEAYNQMTLEGAKSIFVTIRVVGRATLRDIIQQEPYIKAMCVEIDDVLPTTEEEENEANSIADNIENVMVTLSSLECSLKQLSNDAKELDDKFNSDNNKDEDNKDDDDENNTNDGDNTEDDDISSSVSLTSNDRRRRFQNAYQIVLDTDTQGYYVSTNNNNTTTTNNNIVKRTPRELSALSWAAFMTEDKTDDQDNPYMNLQDEALQEASYRIQAIDETNVLERLKLASYMLQQQKDSLRKKNQNEE